MNLGFSKLINLKDLYNIFIFFSCGKDKEEFTKNLLLLIIFINIKILLLILFIFMIQNIFILKNNNFNLEYKNKKEILRRRPFEKLRESSNMFGDTLKNDKMNLKYYQNIQNNFCDNIRNYYNKDLEKNITLAHISLNNIIFDMFIYKGLYNFSSENYIQKENIFHLLNILNYYSNKNDYTEKEILIINIGANAGLYSLIFCLLKYSVLFFEPLPSKYYLSKKNFCRNSKNFLFDYASVTIIDKALYPNKTFCDFYKDIKKKKKDLIICEKKEKIIDDDYIKLDTIETVKLNDFIPSFKRKTTLLVFDLEFEGEMMIKSGKDLITKFHIPFIFIEFNVEIFKIHGTDPKNFLYFFTKNGYKISLNGFLSNEFVTIENLFLSNFSTIYLYIKYIG